MANSRPSIVLCDTCRQPFPVTRLKGPVPKFCSITCQPSRKYTAKAKRQAGKNGGVSPGSAAQAVRTGRSSELRPSGGQTGGHNGHVTVTSETEYSDDEREFLLAVEKYKRERKRPFPALSEVLAIARSLGWRKVEPAGPLPGEKERT